MTEKRRLPIIVGLLCLLLAAASQAEEAAIPTEQPLWELGIGIAPLAMPSYRGSRSTVTEVLPLPYLVYRGDFWQVDRHGVRGLLYDSQRLSLDISGDGALPSSSKDGDRREGMPDLDAAVEVGPSLNLTLLETRRHHLDLRLPVRAVMATDLTSIEHIGFKAHPQLRYAAPGALAGWNLGLNVGPLFADRRYHAYYYDVTDAHARPDRPAYPARAGYSGTAVMLTTSRRFDRFWVGGFIRYDNLAGTAFEHSPLVETRHSLMAGLGLAWVFGQSRQLVPVDHRHPAY